jgi:hypothetical protein
LEQGQAEDQKQRLQKGAHGFGSAALRGGKAPASHRTQPQWGSDSGSMAAP